MQNGFEAISTLKEYHDPNVHKSADTHHDIKLEICIATASRCFSSAWNLTNDFVNYIQSSPRKNQFEEEEITDSHKMMKKTVNNALKKLALLNTSVASAKSADILARWERLFIKVQTDRGLGKLWKVSLHEYLRPACRRFQRTTEEKMSIPVTPSEGTKGIALISVQTPQAPPVSDSEGDMGVESTKKVKSRQADVAVWTGERDGRPQLVLNISQPEIVDYALQGGLFCMISCGNAVVTVGPLNQETNTSKRHKSSVFKCRLPVAEHFLRPNSDALKQQKVKFRLLASPSRSKVASAHMKLSRLTVPQNEMVLKMDLNTISKESVIAAPDVGEGEGNAKTFRLKMLNERKRTECYLPISYAWELWIPDSLGERDTQTQDLLDVAEAETGLDIKGLLSERENPHPQVEFEDKATQCKEELAEDDIKAQNTALHGFLRDDILQSLRETSVNLEKNFETALERVNQQRMQMLNLKQAIFMVKRKLATARQPSTTRQVNSTRTDNSTGKENSVEMEGLRSRENSDLAFSLPRRARSLYLARREPRSVPRPAHGQKGRSAENARLWKQRSCELEKKLRVLRHVCENFPNPTLQTDDVWDASSDVCLPALFMPRRMVHGNLYNPRAHQYFHPFGSSMVRITQPPSMLQLPPLSSNELRLFKPFVIGRLGVDALMKAFNFAGDKTASDKGP